MALWLAVLAAGARFIQGARTSWLVAFVVVSVALAFTRQTAAVLPLTLALATAMALALRSPYVRRLGVLPAAALPAIVILTIFTTAAGLPSLGDLFQDAPTTHFVRPDVADPLGYVIRTNAAQLPEFLGTIVTTPALWLEGSLALAGYVVRYRPWALPFACGLATIPVLYALHPIMTEAQGIFAPMWFSIHMGIGLLAAAAVIV